jgi:butyryl-CoA dehydrogenase
MLGGAGLRLLLETIGATAARADGTEWADLAADLREVSARLADVTAALWSTGDPEVALANATAYLDAAGSLVVAWLWLDQV